MTDKDDAIGNGIHELVEGRLSDEDILGNIWDRAIASVSKQTEERKQMKLSMTQPEIDTLFNMATKAARNAYCPYSHFHVGAAVIAKNGNIYTGCNVENASYGCTMCAERVAILKAVSDGATRITAIAVACPDIPPGADLKLRMSCGACRQVMAQFCDNDVPVFISKQAWHTVGGLIPLAFQFEPERTAKHNDDIINGVCAIGGNLGSINDLLGRKSPPKRKILGHIATIYKALGKLENIGYGRDPG